MNREQEEIQFLGCFGILKESCNIISSWRKIFTQITLSLILPLTFIYLAQIKIEELLFSEIMHNEYVLHHTREGTRRFDKYSDLLFSEWSAYFLFKIGYLIFFMILSLLSTSAVVYTIACVYTARDVSLKKVMSVVPKVWKRLMMTFIWSFVIFFCYNIVSLVVFLLGAFLFEPVKVVGVVFLVLFIIMYVIGFVYVTMIFHLANVVSVLEESYGLKAMAKTRDLIKGKIGVSIGVFFLLGLCFFGVQFMFKMLVVLADGEGIGDRIGYGILSLILMSILMLFGLVAQTVIYFVCKSYHHENIDKPALSDYLGEYLGEYVPLKTKDVQLEHFEV